MDKDFVSKRLVIPKLVLYFFLILGMLFLVLTPFSYVNRASTCVDARLEFALMIFCILAIVFYVFRNYTIKIDTKKVSIYMPLGIKWKMIHLDKITHYILINEGVEWGNNNQLILKNNEKLALKINSYNYNNSSELFEKIISGLNPTVIKLKKH